MQLIGSLLYASFVISRKWITDSDTEAIIRKALRAKKAKIAVYYLVYMETINNFVEIPEPKLSRFLFSNTKMAWFWLIVRVYVGWQWIEAGWGKIHNPAWVGSDAGQALSGFIQGALAKMSGAHPDVQGWYGTFLQNGVLPHASLWSHVVAYGELLVGVALVLGLFAGIAAFFGTFMNFNFLLAGAVSVNPILGFLGLFLILAWRVAGWWGLDRWVLPAVGTPWKPGELFTKTQ